MARQQRSRPLRGTAAATRTRLVAAAARVFNRAGYHGTDSNRLARAAGYAPGSFYKHFPDKRAIFLAAYADWVTAEWAAIEAVVRAGGTPAAMAPRLVEVLLSFHRRWRGFRSSMRALVATDPVVRRFYRRQRARQLEMLATLRGAPGAPPAADDALLLYTLERASDAIAEGEIGALGLSTAAMEQRLTTLVRDYLTSAAQHRPGRTVGRV
jgi:AcrR family transcriptional regulator